MVYCGNLSLQECYLITIFVAIITILPVDYQESLCDCFTEEVEAVKADFDLDSS